MIVLSRRRVVDSAADDSSRLYPQSVLQYVSQHVMFGVSGCSLNISPPFLFVLLSCVAPVSH